MEYILIWQVSSALLSSLSHRIHTSNYIFSCKRRKRLLCGGIKHNILKIKIGRRKKCEWRVNVNFLQWTVWMGMCSVILASVIDKALTPIDYHNVNNTCQRQYIFYSQNIKHWVSSSDPVSIGTLCHWFSIWSRAFRTKFFHRPEMVF